jgi:hypothetical protein
MTTCLLCPSPPIADLLCVPCGAKLWAARVRAEPCRLLDLLPLFEEGQAGDERSKALVEISTAQAGQAFLSRLEAKQAERAAKGGER